MENIAQSIREKILRENFDVIGFAEPQIQKEAKLRLRKFLKRYEIFSHGNFILRMYSIEITEALILL